MSNKANEYIVGPQKLKPERLAFAHLGIHGDVEVVETAGNLLEGQIILADTILDYFSRS